MNADGEGAFHFLETQSPWVILVMFIVGITIFFVVSLVKEWLWIRSSHNQVMRPLLEANKTLEAANKELLEQNGKLIEQADIVSKFFEEADKVKGSG